MQPCSAYPSLLANTLKYRMSAIMLTCTVQTGHIVQSLRWSLPGLAQALLPTAALQTPTWHRQHLKCISYLQAPWGLAVLEAGSALLTYTLLVPCALPLRCGLHQFHYALGHSLEDVVLLSLLRAAAILVSYLCGSARSCKQ